MTIPWMMNCAHSETGWCLECVVKLGNSHAELIAAARKLLKNYDMIIAEEETRFCDDRLVIEFEDLRAVLAKAGGHQ